MRKVMLLAAMLAMVLAAAAPVFAQVEGDVNVDGDDNNTNTNTAQYVDCSQVQVALQGQYGDASAEADDESEAVAEVAAEQGITQQQVNACLGEINDLNQGGDDAGDIVVGSVAAGTVVAGDDGSAAAGGSASAAAGGSASAATETLPETGGSSLLALGAGALLVAGGLLARRIVR